MPQKPDMIMSDRGLILKGEMLGSQSIFVLRSFPFQSFLYFSPAALSYFVMSLSPSLFMRLFPVFVLINSRTHSESWSVHVICHLSFISHLFSVINLLFYFIYLIVDLFYLLKFILSKCCGQAKDTTFLAQSA